MKLSLCWELEGAATPKKARKWKQAATKPKTTSSFTADGNIISDETDDLKGMEMLSDAAMLKKDSRKAMKFSLCDLRSQHQTGGSSEGVGITPEVPDESQAKSTDTNKGARITPEVLDMYKVASMIQDLEEDWGSKEDTVILTSEDERIESVKKTTENEYGHKDEYVHEDDEYIHEEDKHVHDYVEEELNDAEIAKTVKVDQTKDASTQDNQTAALISFTQKGKPKLPPTSSSLSVSSGFGNQFLAYSSDISLSRTLKDNTDVEINLMLDIQIQNEVLNVQALSMLTDEMEKAKTVESPTQMKRHHDDRDQDPPTGPYQGLKKRKKSKNVEQSKKPTSAGSFKGTTQSQPRLTNKSVQAEETVFEGTNTYMPLNQGDNTRNTNEQPAVETVTKDDLGQESYKALLMSHSIDFFAFAMNRLIIIKLNKADLVGPVYNLLKGMCKSYMELEYTIKECYHALSDNLDWNNLKEIDVPITSANLYLCTNLEIKATKYDVEGIEDTVPKLWSPIKEIVVQRVDRKLYKFMEGDFLRLHLNDIEDMLLLVVQNKLLNLEGDEIVDLAVALRSAIYHSLKTQGVIYGDMLKRKRLMHTNELYKFSDGTLTLVRNTLDQMLKNLRLGYNKAMQKRK
ncbi:hypothetical protein Tco_1540243 [Tanacetum coccineum]